MWPFTKSRESIEESNRNFNRWEELAKAEGARRAMALPRMTPETLCPNCHRPYVKDGIVFYTARYRWAGAYPKYCEAIEIKCGNCHEVQDYRVGKPRDAAKEDDSVVSGGGA